MARYHACKCPTPVRWSRPNVAVSDGIGRVARVSWTRDYLFEGVKECVILLWVVEGENRMGRESSDALEQAALSFLSGIDTDLGLDAALFVRRTGLVLASWMREGIRLDVVSVMAATMLASVDTIIESVGGPTPEVISVDTDAHQILATKVNSRAFLVVIAPKKVSRAVVRKTMRGLNARLAVAGSKSTHLHVEQTEKQRVNVRPPR